MRLAPLDDERPGLIDALLGAGDETVCREWGFELWEVRSLRAAVLMAEELKAWTAGLVLCRDAEGEHPALRRHPGAAAMLGKATDREVAERFGLSRERVRQLRVLAGLPRFSRRPRRSVRRKPPVSGPAGPAALERWVETGWKGPSSGDAYVARVRMGYPGLVEALPTTSTKEIERTFGLNKKAVRYLRAFLGIPSPG